MPKHAEASQILTCIAFISPLICVAAYCAVHLSAPILNHTQADKIPKPSPTRHSAREREQHTLPVVLKHLNDLIHHLDRRMSLPLRLANLLWIAATLLYKILYIDHGAREVEQKLAIGSGR